MTWRERGSKLSGQGIAIKMANKARSGGTLSLAKLGYLNASIVVDAEYILEATDLYRYLDEIPESLRIYVKFDTEQMARDMEIGLYVVEGESGGVFVFDPRC